MDAAANPSRSGLPAPLLFSSPRATPSSHYDAPPATPLVCETRRPCHPSFASTSTSPTACSFAAQRRRPIYDGSIWRDGSASQPMEAAPAVPLLLSPSSLLILRRRLRTPSTSTRALLIDDWAEGDT
ncbi:hypothetical protein VPH35_109657 [Triticum aestivum]